MCAGMMMAQKIEVQRCTQKCVQHKTDEKESPAFSCHKIFNMHIPPTQILRVYITHNQRECNTNHIPCNIFKI